MDLISLNSYATELILLMPVAVNIMIVLRVMHLTYTRSLIRLSNCAKVSRLGMFDEGSTKYVQMVIIGLPWPT